MKKWATPLSPTITLLTTDFFGIKLAETERRSFVSPKLDFEPTAPSYDMVVSNDNNTSYNNTNYVNLNAENNILKEEDDYLPSYEQAIAMNKETQE